MPKFQMQVDMPIVNVEEFVEKMREFGAVESVTITVEAENKREAVSWAAESLSEYYNTYSRRMIHFDDVKKFVQQKMRRTVKAVK